jgi:hypothetical protein
MSVTVALSGDLCLRELVFGVVIVPPEAPGGVAPA